MTIIQGPFDWFHIIWQGQVVQAFRTESECRQWIADIAPLIRALGL